MATNLIAPAAPLRQHPPLIALRVENDSMASVAPVGAVILVAYADKKLVPNGFYVVRHNNVSSFRRYSAERRRFECDAPDVRPIPVKGAEVIGRVTTVQRDIV